MKDKRQKDRKTEMQNELIKQVLMKSNTESRDMFLDGLSILKLKFKTMFKNTHNPFNYENRIKNKPP